MNVPPEIPAMSTPPAAPPPPKSNALKWILIGCGGAAFLGLLVCAGCLTIGYFFVKGAINHVVAQVKPIIAENEAVKAEIGDVREVKPNWSGFKTQKRNGRDIIECSLDVEGTKGRGVVLVRMYETGKKDEFIVHLTFRNQSGNKMSEIGTWRLYDDKKGNAGFEPIKGEPPPEPGDHEQD